MLTCNACLRGNQHRCERGACANWARRAAPAGAYGTRPGRGTREGRGAPRSTTPEQEAGIARYVVVGNEMASIADLFGVGYAVVKRVRDELRTLQAAGFDAGPVHAERLPCRARGGRNGTGKFGIRPGPPEGEGGAPLGTRAGPEAAHKAALLLIEGHTYAYAAEVAGITVHQARTVRANLRVLAGLPRLTGRKGQKAYDPEW